MSLRDLQASPTAHNRRARRKQNALERATTQESKTNKRREVFTALLNQALGHLARGGEPDDELMVVVARSWDPGSDEPFREATTHLYKLAVEGMRANNAKLPTAPRLARMFRLMAGVYCGEDQDVAELRNHLLLALRHPEWRPPWIENIIDPRPSGEIQIPDGVPPWLTVLGPARGAFLQGMLPSPDMRIGLWRMPSGHPWAMFLLHNEIRQMCTAASNKRKSNAIDPRPKVPRGPTPWQMTGLPPAREVVLGHARDLDELVPGLDLAADMSAAMNWLSGEEKNLTVDVPMLLAVSPAVSTAPTKHGTGTQVVRGLLDRGVDDTRLLSTLADLSDSRARQLKKERQPK